MSLRGYFTILLLSNSMAVWAGILLGCVHTRRQVVKMLKDSETPAQLVSAVVKFLTGKALELPQ